MGEEVASRDVPDFDDAESLGTGRQFAERVRIERVRRGWSQAELARRMRAVGHALDQAAISKIESPPESDRARRVDIDEAIAFSRIFSLSLTEMTLPQMQAQEREVLLLLARGAHLAADFNAAAATYRHAVMAVALGVELFPLVERRVKEQWEALSARTPSEDRAREFQFLEDVVRAADDEEYGVPRYRRDHVDLEREISTLLDRMFPEGVRDGD